MSSFAGAHTTVDPKRFDVHDHHREGYCSGSRRETLLHCLETEMRQSLCPCVRFLVADVGCISECPLRVANEKVCYCTGVTDDLSSVDTKGLNYQDCQVLFHINRQSPTLQVVCTSVRMVLMTVLVSKACCTRMVISWWFRAHGKTQVTIEHVEGTDESLNPRKIHTVVTHATAAAREREIQLSTQRVQQTVEVPQATK